MSDRISVLCVMRKLNLKGRDHLEEIFIDGRITFYMVSDKLDIKVWTGFIYCSIRFKIAVNLTFLKSRKFLDQSSS